MDFKTLKNKQIEAEIARVVGELHGYFDWRVQQWLGVALPDVPEKHYQHTPLALSLRAIFDHVTGANPQPETVRDSCQLVCEALFVAPGNQGSTYEIPAEFWATLTGRAVQSVLGPRPELPDDAEITGEEAESVVGRSRQAIDLARQSGKLTARGSKKGTRSVWLYRVEELRKWAK